MEIGNGNYIPLERILFLLLYGIVVLAGIWKTFEKAGRPGWAALIPIYNLYIMLKISGKPGAWLFFLILPPAGLIMLIWALNMVSKSFGKDEAFTAGLLSLGFIFWPILGFGKAKYYGPYGDPVTYQRYLEYQE